MPTEVFDIVDEPVCWPEVEVDLLGVTVWDTVLEADLVLEGDAEALGQCDSLREVVWVSVFFELADGLLEVEGLDETVGWVVKVKTGLIEVWSVTLGLDVWDTEAVDE